MPAPTPEAPVSARETTAAVLVVDDDSATRVLYEIYLRSFGYVVLLARDGDEALRVAAGRSDIRIMIMDVVMPGLSGQRLVDAAKIALPGVRILFCSGHPAKVLTGYGIDPAVEHFLQKPCRPADFKRKMDELSASS